MASLSEFGGLTAEELRVRFEDVAFAIAASAHGELRSITSQMPLHSEERRVLNYAWRHSVGRLDPSLYVELTGRDMCADGLARYASTRPRPAPRWLSRLVPALRP